MRAQQQDPQPVCGSCGGTMSSQDRAEWFCPGCAEYARNLPTIYPRSPAHPTFKRRLEDEPELAVGFHLIVSEPQGKYGNPVGEITSYDSEAETYTIINELDHPFTRTTRVLSADKLLEFLETADIMNPPRDKSNQLVLRLE